LFIIRSFYGGDCYMSLTDAVYVTVNVLPRGLVVSPQGKAFYMQHSSFKKIEEFIETFPVLVDIKVVVDNSDSTNIEGSSNGEKFNNLKIFLRDLNSKTKIFVSNEEEFLISIKE